MAERRSAGSRGVPGLAQKAPYLGRLQSLRPASRHPAAEGTAAASGRSIVPSTRKKQTCRDLEVTVRDIGVADGHDLARMVPAM